jgi:predicted dehydrogenase
MMDKVRVGVIGCGTIAQRGHLPWYWENPNVEILAVCSDIEDEVRNTAKRWNAKRWFIDYNELLALEEIDAISICTPVWLHKEIAVEAAKRGKHILCEKPMARTVEECNEMIEECRKNNVKLMVGFMKRFNPGFQKIKEIIDRGLIGKVHHLDIHWNLYFPPGSRPARIFCEEERVGGGVLLDNCCHYIDTFRWFLSAEIDTVYAEITKVIPERVYEDQAILTLRFNNGTTSILDMGLNRVEWVKKSAWENEGMYSQHFSELGFIYGTEGTIYFDAPPFESVEAVNIKVYLLEGKGCEFGGWHEMEIPVVRQPGGPLSPREVITYAFKREIDHFVDCIYNDKKIEVSGEDGRIVTQVLAAAYQSSETGKRIHL